MDSLYSKNALLTWLVQITKKPAKTLEDLANGVHFCLLLNLLTKGQFNLAKINTSAKLEHQKLHNLKQMIYGMEKNHIMKHVDITKIASKHLNTILELLQWFRKEMNKFQKEQPNKKKMAFTVKGEIKRQKSFQKSELSKSNSLNIDCFKQMKQTSFIELPPTQNKENASKMENSPFHNDQQHVTIPYSQSHRIQPIHQNEQNIAPTSEQQNHHPVNVLEKSARSNNHFPNPYFDLHKEKEQIAKTDKLVLQKTKREENASKGKGTNSEIKNNELIKNVQFQKSELKVQPISEKSISKEERPVSKQKSCLKSPGQILKSQRGENISFGVSPKTDFSDCTSLLSHDEKMI